MKSKSTLTLMELLIMLLVFVLAAALCLQAFAGAHNISSGAADLDRAVLAAQNAAEVLKACAGDYETAAAIHGGSWDGSRWLIQYEGGILRAVPEDSGHPLLERAVITVTDGGGSTLYTLTAAWQKGGDSHG